MATIFIRLDQDILDNNKDKNGNANDNLPPLHEICTKNAA